VRVARCGGTSDDLDRPIEEVFADAEARESYRLGTLNSVNVVRMLMQAVHLFYCYLRADPSASSEAVLAIPTGAGGHATAALIARRMGLPVAAVLACTNENDLLPRLLEHGEAACAPVVRTSSPAMDIQVPYNIERILYMATGGDHTRVSKWMSEFAADGVLKVGRDVAKLLQDMGLRAVSLGRQEVLEAVRQTHDACGYIVDPHTGVGLAGLRWMLEEAGQSPQGDGGIGLDCRATRLLCTACAHPSKFPEFILEAFGCQQEYLLDAIPNKELYHVRNLLDLVQKSNPGKSVREFPEKDRYQWKTFLMELIQDVWEDLNH